MSDRTKKWLFTAGSLTCLLLAFTLLNVFRGRFTEPETPDSQHSAVIEVQVEEETTGERWFVYVTGAVEVPGVYEISADSRVLDAVRAAGGLAADGDGENINLAARLSDGEHIKVPFKGRPISEPSEPLDTPKKTPSPQRPEAKINLNTATYDELCTLPGVGPKTSSAIIEDRKKNGRYSRVDDLLRVNGIGRKKLEALRSFIHVD